MGFRICSMPRLRSRLLKATWSIPFRLVAGLGNRSDGGSYGIQFHFSVIGFGNGLLDRCRGVVCRLSASLREIAHFVRDDRETQAGPPARAASTAALSARMLVWKAISSTTLMFFEIRPL
jgi:hypothetical protein